VEKVLIVGMGPGGEDYLLPVAQEAIKSADVLVGSKRHLAAYRSSGKILKELKGNFSEILDYIVEKRIEHRIAVLVSGDPCIYSYLKPISRRLKHSDFEVIPGLSSFQVACAKTATLWHDALVVSVHGRSLENLLPAVKKGKTLIIFTGKKHDPQAIAAFLLDHGIEDRTVWLGENLSYDNERLVETNLVKIKEGGEYGLCIMIMV
jgi:precorrin-6y C5,15-methyltransferase (decarboxylating) CbiE subunit